METYYLRLKRLRGLVEKAQLEARMNPQMALADKKAQDAVQGEMDRLRWALHEYERWHYERRLDEPWQVRSHKAG